MIRRQFIRTSAMAVAGTMALPKFLSAAPKYPQKLVGLQLYSVRDDMKLNPLGTLKQLSSIGYKYVEHADYVKRKFYGYEAKEFKKILDDLGLKMPSGHTVFTSKHWDESKKDFTDDWKYTIEDAATCGQQFVISPWLEEGKRKDADTLKGFMDIFNKNGVHTQYRNYADVNFKDWEHLYYGKNYAKLQLIKNKYDPDNIIRSEQSIKNIEERNQKFTDILKMLEQEEIRNRVGAHMVIMEKAVEKERDRLSSLHTYMDNSIDQPLLTPENVI